ncbi:hypothetical protein IV203_007533 [Nitzschia inconspicua]|uniref:Uncharacterized protein n=1 Tax=Nitzschia inconspicua TaxID=303405 RepID=A0A9K3KF30_9STRA|nr:hypothetical protein IV203_007533 [Nitzschia inconspicua]
MRSKQDKKSRRLERRKIRFDGARDGALADHRMPFDRDPNSSDRSGNYFTAELGSAVFGGYFIMVDCL